MWIKCEKPWVSETQFFFPAGSGEPPEVCIRGNNMTRTVVSKDKPW